MADEEGGPAKGNKAGMSVITDPRQERKRVALSTFAVLSGAASYIIMLFVAMPISIHLIVNTSNGCDPSVDVACFAPTESSQETYTLILTLLRLMTFLFGSIVGTLSDRYGRRPMLIMALTGYAITGVMFMLGWVSQSIALFFAGGIILGASSPITPHGVAYVSDISQPDRLAPNLGVLQGVGYFLGLMTGALISLLVSQLTTGAEKVAGEGGIEPYNKLFYGSYGAGLLFSASSALVTLFFLPESLHKSDRTTKIDYKKANPIGFLVLVTRNPYLFCVWLSAFFAWMAVGAAENVTGGWWLRRYTLTNVSAFIQYTVSLWVSSGIGSVIMTKIYVMVVGLKGAVHISAIFTMIVGVSFALAPDASTSYIAVGLSFFASAVYPTTLAVLMGQVNSREKGALAGAIRSSEALAKMIGIAVFGNIFAKYIAPFRPDPSCVPDDYSSSNNANTCECGVESCPIYDSLFSADGPRYLPSMCSLGQLSPAFNGKPSATIPALGAEETMPAWPHLLIDAGVERPETCLGPGLVPNVEGFSTEVPRSWCLAPSALAPVLGPENAAIWNQGLGCPEFDLTALQTDIAWATNAGACQQQAPSCDLELLNNNYTIVNNLTYAGEIAGNAADPFLFTNNMAGNFTDTCPMWGKAKVNVCLAGPISSFPGLLPLIYMTGLGAISYLFFIIAELLFVSRDKKYWKTMEEEHLEETGNIVMPIDET